MSTPPIKSFENARWTSFRQSIEFRHTAALGLIKEGPVLDIGCGDGLLLSLCKDARIEAQGIDFSDAAILHCKEQELNTQQVDISILPLPFADKSFPIVIALDVLEHTYDPLPLLSEMKRISSRNVIIGVPNFSSLPARLQMFFGKVPENNRSKKGHIYWFNWSVLYSLVKKSGLRISSLRVNALWERMPLIGFLSRALAKIFPSLFALSFVIVCDYDSTS